MITPDRSHTRLAITLGLGALALAVPAAAAPRVLGHRDCEKCHKPAVDKWLEEEAAQFGAEAHTNTHKQLAGPKATQFAAAIGANATDPDGRCAQCHATVVRGRVRSGVSCETCHGAASDYLDVHDDEPWRASYAKAIPLGMRDLHGKAGAIAAMCVDCHVTPEKALAAAGHPNGADFDAGASLRKLVHWTAKFTPNGAEHASYDFGQVSAAGGPLVAKALARGGGGARSADSPAAAPRRDTPAAAPRSAPRGTAGAAAFDWSQPVAALPDDYPSDAGRTPPAAPSIAEDLPLPMDDVPLTAPAPARPVARRAPSIAAPAPAADPEPDAPGERPPAELLAELRGRAATLLAELLGEQAGALPLDAPQPPREFQGPDGELLHLQDVVLYLALEELRSKR